MRVVVCSSKKSARWRLGISGELESKHANVDVKQRENSLENISFKDSSSSNFLKSLSLRYDVKEKLCERSEFALQKESS